MYKIKMSFTYFILSLLLTLVVCLSSCINADQQKFTEKEINTLAKFRPMVQDVLLKNYEKKDDFLIRWLKAKEMNIPAAVEMLRKAQKWRQHNRIDGIINENILNFTNPPYFIDGVDKEGFPIVTWYIQRFDTRKRIIQGREAKFVRFFYQYLEKLTIKIREMDGNSSTKITQSIIIYDFTNYNLVQHGCLGCFPIYLEWLQHYENYYPELAKLLIFINLPRIAVPLVEFLKPAMSPSTRKVLHVFGPDRTEWSSFLLKYISKDQLSYQFGGNKKN